MTKDKFFRKVESLGLAVTFGDVQLKSGHSRTPPAEVSLATKFSRHVPLKCPLVSAAMEITESAMAIELAKYGGLGVIHSAMTPERQAAEVAKVKFYLNGLIERPVCVREEDVISDIETRAEGKGWPFHSFPVVDGAGRLRGVLTGQDFEFCQDHSCTVRDTMTKGKLVTAPKGTPIRQAYKIMVEGKKKLLPLVDREGRLSGLYVYSDLRRIIKGGPETARYNVDGQGHLRVAAAIPANKEEAARIELLLAEHVDVIVIESAHADFAEGLRVLREWKRRYPQVDFVIGNISEGESAKRLADAGADGIKVGQGPGSICTTRVITGVGCPQVTAVYNCAKAMRGSGIPVCADGGVTSSGALPIAIGAGAHSVMLGRMLAGTDEAPGETMLVNGMTVKTFRGMGSLGAMAASKAARERYRQQDAVKDSLVPEGVEAAVPYQGKVSGVLHQLIEGLRRGMNYVGARDIGELQRKADFRWITNAGVVESHPHDLLHVKQAPNYHNDYTKGR